MPTLPFQPRFFYFTLTPSFPICMNTILFSYIVQVVIHYFDKQSAEFINSAAGAITVSYIMQLLTGLLGREFSAVIYATQSISNILSISGEE
ncbi:hypothetical protein DAI22_04g111700 [Oryza sativa Japonica Group]|uniref:OSJNBa0039C07.9 protein n=1 Tax=Oryza sativa subsp. japonica TaxID=39947 RepID=Q7XLG7_ORYSJ|nr:hypothetical protein DAI22_04g111700 [Oryza sativa Japonica Group]CAE05153.2 OSJNBa0039C07.9 [Oryza sativa Japonica Group]